MIILKINHPSSHYDKGKHYLHHQMIMINIENLVSLGLRTYDS